ncbi:MAG: methylated-DNA--[protein]-cysteine S-methyltransferase [Lewinellaceae bacterium]|nr:methylated-DNA--[protein]-cysteine S-methyltransferase [Lewinellaceae bacterium]
MLKKSYCASPIGWFEIIGSELGVRSVKRCAEEGTSDDLPEDHPVAMGKQQLEEYFAGTRRYFELKLDWGGTPDFYREVWKVVSNIPYGQTMAYSEIAEQLQQPKAVRAVGMANRNNPCAIVVPCHRVIGKAGELRGYFYGLDTKMALLRHENPVRFAEQTSLF